MTAAAPDFDRVLTPNPKRRERIAMKKDIIHVAPSPKTRIARRGAGMVEYALLLVAVLILAAGAFKALGAKVATGAAKATDEFSSSN